MGNKKIQNIKNKIQKVGMNDKPIIEINKFANVFDRFAPRFQDALLSKFKKEELVDILTETLSGDEARKLLTDYLKAITTLPSLIQHSNLVLNNIATRMDQQKKVNFTRYEKTENKLNQIHFDVKNIEKELKNIKKEIDDVKKTRRDEMGET